MAEDVFDDGFDVACLVAAFGEGSGIHRVGVDDLEIEVGRALFSFGCFAAAEGGEGAADEAAYDLIDKAEAVAFVGAEGEEGGDGVGVLGGVSVGIDGGVWGELFSFTFELLDAAHGDGGGGPVDDDGIADGVGGGESPGVGVGAEGGEFSSEGDDFGEGCGAIGVGDVAALGGVHDVASAPEVVEGVVYADLADAVFVGHGDAGFHGFEGGGLAELHIGVPDLGGFEFAGELFDGGTGGAAAAFGAEELVEVEGFDRIVGADAVGGGHLAKFGSGGGFFGGEAAVLVGGLDEGVVRGGGDGFKFGHIDVGNGKGEKGGLFGYFCDAFWEGGVVGLEDFAAGEGVD